MKQFLIILCFSLSFAAYAQPPNFEDNWMLVFSDEFSADTLNTDVWNYDSFLGTGGVHCWDNLTDQWYTDSTANIFIKADGSDTSLFLKLIYDPISACPDSNNITRVFGYSSGWIQSCRRFQYGYFEARCKLPIADSVWPAFWLFKGSGGTDEQLQDSLYNYWYDEIDIFEASGDSTKYEVNYFDEQWYTGSSPNQWRSESIVQKHGNKIPDSVDNVSEYHTYGVEWRENFLQFYCDGEPERLFVDRIPNHPLLLILNLAMVRNRPILDSANFIIDYVRVYKQKSVLDSMSLAIFDTVILKNQFQIDVAPEQHYILNGNGQDGAFVELEAERFIHLHAGFHGENGSILSAKIVPLDIPCNGKAEMEFYEENSTYNKKNVAITKEEISNKISKDKSVKIYPNPNNGNFTIQYDAAAIESVEIFDFSGRKVNANLLFKSEHLREVTLNYSGLFVLKLSDGENIFVKKVYVKP